MSGAPLRGVAEASLIGVAAVWGLTFVMVKDAVELLPTPAFLAYRFLPAALLVAVVFWRPLRGLSGAGWRAGLLMGTLLTAGYLFQTLGLERTSASRAGFITGLFVVLTPVLAAIFLRQRVGGAAWAAALVSALGLYLLSGAGGDFEPAGDGLVLLCAVAFAGHILATARASGTTTPGRWSRCSWRCAGWSASASPRRPVIWRLPEEPPSGRPWWSPRWSRAPWASSSRPSPSGTPLPREPL